MIRGAVLVDALNHGLSAEVSSFVAAVRCPRGDSQAKNTMRGFLILGGGLDLLSASSTAAIALQYCFVVLEQRSNVVCAHSGYSSDDHHAGLAFALVDFS